MQWFTKKKKQYSEEEIKTGILYNDALVLTYMFQTLESELPICIQAKKNNIPPAVEAELIQESIFLFWHKVKTGLYTSTNYIGFCCLTAKNKFYERLKREKKHIDTDILAEILEDTTSDNTIIDILIHTEKITEMMTAYNTLDKKCIKLLNLTTYTEEKRKTHAEIAEIFNITEGSVKPKKFRCMEELRKKLRLLGWNI